MLKRLKKFWHNSQTKAWSYIQLGGSGVLAAATSLNHAISQPSVKEYLDKLTVPVSITIGLAAIGIITFVCHGHDD